MTRKTLVQEYVPNAGGPRFGKLIEPNHFMNSQQYAHSHVDKVTRDLLVAGAAATQVFGFDITAYGSMFIAIAQGEAFGTNGALYETIPQDAQQVNFTASEPSAGRIDLVYALLETEVGAEFENKPFVQLRTTAEYSSGVPPYSPTAFYLPNELHTRATLGVRRGVASATPVAPALNSGEVALYQVSVPANATAITSANVTDVRPKARSLATAWSHLDALNSNPAITSFSEVVDDRVAALLAVGAGLTRVYDDALNQLLVGLDYGVLDARYANASGDNLTGLFTIFPDGNLDDEFAGVLRVHRYGDAAFSGVVRNNNNGQTTHATVGKAINTFINCTGYGVRGVSNNGEPAETKGENGVIIGVGGEARAVDAYAMTLYGVKGTAIGTSLGAASVAYAVYGSASGAPTTWAGYFAGNVNITGSVSKGGGTFLIDHPLDEANTDLYHGFVEAPEYLNVYRGEVALVNGKAEVNIDAACRLQPGTFVAITQDARVQSLHNLSDFTRLRSKPIKDGKFEIVAEDAKANSTVAWVVMAARADALVKTFDNVDNAGRLIPEQAKLEVPAATVEMMHRTRIEIVEDTDGWTDDGEDVVEIVEELVGTKGFPRHADRIGRGTVPKRRVIKKQRSDIASPTNSGEKPTRQKASKRDSNEGSKGVV